MTKSLRIVAADDEPLMRAYYQRIVPRLGHQLVGVAENGAELVQLAGQEGVDLLITDVRMPEMDGLEAASLVSERRPIPILFLTACADALPRDWGGPFRAVMVLRKPVGRVELAAAITRVMRQHQLG